MTATPVITIFVRHAADCKYAGDEFCKRCDCKKHFRWTANGRQFRQKAGTRSWAEAEERKRRLEDELAGRKPQTDDAQFVSDAIDIFLKDKEVQGVTPKVLARYTRELERLKGFCESKRVLTVQGLTRELLTDHMSTWTVAYPSSTSRARVRERLRSFLRFCYQAEWLSRVPDLPKIKIDEPPTLPLTANEYKSLLDAVYVTIEDKGRQAKVHALLQLMRWSGLAIRDALTIARAELQKTGDVWRVTTARQKTGVHVSVPIPPKIAEELLAVANGNPKYIFWSGNGAEETITKTYQYRYIAPLFKAAKIENDGHMVSHRLRDTFAVDLLDKGVPLEEVSKLLGHESIRTTERHYAKWVKGRQERLDALVIGTWNKTQKNR
jgi:integrase/recombinase XerD